MKHKSSKRSSSNKQHHHRSSQSQTRRLSIQNDHTQTISPNHIDLGIGPVHLDSYTPCLKPNVPLKSQKLLKRDLLRCSNQRPSLLGPQTLQPPRIHHNSRKNHSIASSSSTSSSSERSRRRRSLSVNSQTFYATIDRIGPWPDISINRLRSNRNDLLRPLKNFRNNKNSRLFSPKYYAGLNDNTSKFKFYPSKHTYIQEYRKQKGYLLTTKQSTSVSLSSSRQALQSDDDQLSAIGTYSGGAGNRTVSERTNLSVTNLSISTQGLSKSADDLLDNHVSSISSVTKQLYMFPSIPVRNNHHHHNNNNIRTIRHLQQQALTLPPLVAPSLRYLNSMNAVDKAYHTTNNKKSSKENQSKLYFIDGRQKKRFSNLSRTDSEVTTCSQDHLGFRTACSPVVTATEQPSFITVYQLVRRTQNDIESFI